MGFCTNCGADVPEGARFCASCGIQLIYDKDTSKDINEDNKNKLAWTYEDDKTEKQMGILPGIIALCLAIAGCFLDLPILSIVVAVLSIVLAIFAIVKKCKLKGFAITAIVVSTISLLFTAYTLGAGDRTDDKEKDNIENSVEINNTDAVAVKEISISEEEGTAFNIGGFTFTIPVGYEVEGNGKFQRPDSIAKIEIDKYDIGISSVTDDTIFEQLDEFIDEEVADELIPGSQRRSADIISVAGFAAKKYNYFGELMGVDAETNIIFIIDTEVNDVITVIAVSAGNVIETVNSDLEEMIQSAKYTGVQDSDETIGTSSVKEVSNADKMQRDNGQIGVDPDLVAFLQEYEAFMDEYIDFMEKYYANPTNTKLLSEYADILEEYEKFVKKADAYDTDEMSTEDAAYYIEVTSRISQKMLRVVGSMGNY